MTMNEARLLEFWKKTLPVHDCLYYEGVVPEALLHTVREVYALEVSERILLAYDDTLFGGGADGFVVTASHFGFKNIMSSPQLIAFEELQPGEVQYDGSQVTVRGEVVGMTGEVTALKAGVGRALRQTAQGVFVVGPTGPYRDSPGIAGAHQLLTALREALPENEDLYYRGAIPSRKLKNVAELHRIDDEQDILLVYDDTVFGSAEEGFVITGSKIFWKGIAGGPVSVELRMLRKGDITLENGELLLKGKSVEITGGSNAPLVAKLAEVLRGLL